MGSESPVPTILIVDDEPTITEVVAEVLGDEGYATITARGGSDALALMAAQRPDLMLLDLVMPEMSGIDLLARLQGDANLASIPVVMMTAGSYGNLVLSHGGPTQLLSKPFNVDDLIATVRTMV